MAEFDRLTARTAAEIAAQRSRLLLSIPVRVRESMLDAMQRRAAEKGLPGRNDRYSLVELDLPADLKEKIADAFAQGGWREDWASVATVTEQANAVLNAFRHH
jgi:hypothetical protein